MHYDDGFNGEDAHPIRSVRPQVLGPVLKIAEGQDQFQTIEGVRARVEGYDTPLGSSYNAVVLAFRLTEADLVKLTRQVPGGFTAELYVSLLTFGQPMQAIQVFANKEDCARAHLGMRALDLGKLTHRLDQAMASAGPNPKGDELVGVSYGDLLAIRRAGQKLALDTIPLADFLPAGTTPNEMRTPDA
jgi:hypothetical protein